MNFWAYALGALDYVTLPGADAPATGLTQAQLIASTPATRRRTCRSSATGARSVASPATSSSTHRRPSSGTYSFFKSKLLNGATIDQNCDPSHLSTFLEEHDARGVSMAFISRTRSSRTTGPVGTQQHTSFEANLTNGAVLGKFGVATPIAPDGRERQRDGEPLLRHPLRLQRHPQDEPPGKRRLTRSTTPRASSACATWPRVVRSTSARARRSTTSRRPASCR